MGERLKTRQDYRVHTLFLSALFVLGNAIITFPKNGADDNTFLGFLIAFVVSLILAIPICKAVDYLFFSERIQNKKIITVIYVIASAFIVFDAAVCFGDFTDFVTHSILPDASRLLISIVLLLVLLWSATRPDSTILKFSLFSFVVVAAVLVFFFIFSIKSMHIEYIFLLSLPDFHDVILQTLPYLYGVFLSTITTLIYQKMLFGALKPSRGVVAIAVSGVMFSIALLNSILLFGSQLSGEYKYPYADAISVVSIGDLFTRMDGFAYFVFFATCFIKLTVSVFVISGLFGRMGVKNKKITAAVATVIVFVLSFLLF